MNRRHAILSLTFHIVLEGDEHFKLGICSMRLPLICTIKHRDPSSNCRSLLLSFEQHDIEAKPSAVETEIMRATTSDGLNTMATSLGLA